jgi:hypothetical protein
MLKHCKLILMPMVMPGSLEKGIASVCRYAEDAVDDGFEVLDPYPIVLRF